MKNFKKRASVFLTTILIISSTFFISNSIVNNNNNIITTVTSAPEGSTLNVTFLDVGQGNCVIAESNGHYLLIDGGNKEHSSLLVSYLQDLGVTRLDYVVISHYDADHLSGIIGVLNNYDVDKIIAPDYLSDTKTFSSYTSVLTTKNYNPIHPRIGDVFSFGDASFQIVSPIKYTYTEDNNNSIGIKLTDGSHSFLLLGDAESESEAAILELDLDLSCDVYMVSHHGSSSSSTNPLLEAAHPGTAVISVGTNDYGHPTKDTIDRLISHNINILRTDQDGTIIAYSGKDFLVWNTNFDTKSISSKKDSSLIPTEVHFIGNKNSMKFHLPTCTGLPIASNQIYIETRQEAIDSGYSPCKICKP